MIYIRQLYINHIKSILTYGAEAWAVTKSIKQDTGYENESTQGTTGKSKRNRKRNSKIKEKWQLRKKYTHM